ncbi:O-antigen ligase family protein [Devosia submarina]|uniref:O-antigen ligase family protein n=1 Tax=Devosia submarina TaxID=1173082 RepID=UPI001300468A|nr:O-antigen ligase family protein [Devosia submarina]
MLARLLILLAWAALLAGLTLPSMAPGRANITTLVMMGIGLVLLAVQSRPRQVLADWGVRLTLLAGALLFVALVATASSAMHLAAILILAPLWFFAGHSALLTQLGERLRPAVVGGFAIAGAGAGAAIAAADVLIFGLARGGGSVNNPIHFADLTLMLGFVGLVGITEKPKLSLFFMLGPVFALVAIWFSGSRGPFLAFGPMLVVGGGMLALLLLPTRRALLLLAAGGVVLGILSFALISSGAAGRLGDIAQIGTLLTGTTADASANERLHMLQSALQAFWASPIFGHGILDYTDVAQSYAPPDMNYRSWGHLHNDVADFAVIAGTLGLLSYVLLVLAPFASGLANKGRWRNATIYLGTVTPLGYFAMGLTNAMFGVLAQTTLYAVILSLIAALSRQGKDLPA